MAPVATTVGLTGRVGLAGRTGIVGLHSGLLAAAGRTVVGVGAAGAMGRDVVVRRGGLVVWWAARLGRPDGVGVALDVELVE
jgi:hypothetical protein